MIRHLAKGILFYTLLTFLVMYGPPSFATEVNHNTSDDAYTQFTLPFDFEHYGVSFDTAKMYTNGVVQFGDQGYNHFCCNGEEYGGSGYYQNSSNYDISYTIMPLWTDLISNNANSRQYTENNGTSFTFGWDNVYEYYRTSNNSFAVTIDDTGSWYVEYDAVDILYHEVTVGSVGDYDADEWDQFTYRTRQQNTTLSDVNGYTGYTTEQEEQQTIVQQFTSDGICDYTAIEDPDCTSVTETFYENEETYSGSGQDDGSIPIDDGQDDGSSTDTYSNTVAIINEDQIGSSSTINVTTSPDGQDSGDAYGDTGTDEEIYSESSQQQDPLSEDLQDFTSTGSEDAQTGSETDAQQAESNSNTGTILSEENASAVHLSNDDLLIDPNAALNADSAFITKQRSASFRRSVNSRAVAHLVSVGGLPTIGATSAEQYQAMTSSGSTVNGMLVNQEMANDPSRMFMPANPNNPSGMMLADASQSQTQFNTFDPNQTGMYGVPDSDANSQALQGMIVASESPMGNEIELEEALSTDDLGGLSINDFVQPKLADQSNWYSNENSLAQKSIYNNQQFYKQQEIYTGVNWYGN